MAEAEPADQPAPEPPPRRRSRRRLILGGIGLVLLLAAAAVAYVLYAVNYRLYYAGPEPVVRAKPQTLAPEAVATEGVAISPDGHVYFAGGEGFVYRLRDDDMPEVWKDLRTVVPGEGPPSICQIAFAPNGDMYVAHFGRGALHRIAADGTLTTLDTDLAGPNFVSWHPAGYVFLTDSEAAVLYRYDPDGANKTVIVPAGTVSYPNGFAFTPDGRAILLNSCDTGTVWRVPLDADYRAAGPPERVRFYGEHFFHKAILDGMLRLPDGTYLTCDFFGNQLIRIREDGTPVQRIALGPAVTGEPIYPASLALTADGALYVTNLGFVFTQRWGRGLYRLALPAAP